MSLPSAFLPSEFSLGGVVEILLRPLPRTGLPDAPVLIDGVDQRPPFLQVVAEGLLAEDVLPRACREDADHRVPVGKERQHRLMFGIGDE